MGDTLTEVKASGALPTPPCTRFPFSEPHPVVPPTHQAHPPPRPAVSPLPGTLPLHGSALLCSQDGAVPCAVSLSGSVWGTWRSSSSHWVWDDITVPFPSTRQLEDRASAPPPTPT